MTDQSFRIDEPTLTRILSELAPVIGGDLLEGGVPYRVGLASAIIDRLRATPPSKKVGA